MRHLHNSVIQAGLRASASIMESRPSVRLRIQLIRHSLAFSPNVFAQGRKSLGFQLLQYRSKIDGERRTGVADKYDLKTNCKQIAAYFVWRGEEAYGGRGGPWQGIVGLPR